MESLDERGQLPEQGWRPPSPSVDGLLGVGDHQHPPWQIVAAFSGEYFANDRFHDVELRIGSVLELVQGDVSYLRIESIVQPVAIGRLEKSGGRQLIRDVLETIEARFPRSESSADIDLATGFAMIASAI